MFFLSSTDEECKQFTYSIYITYWFAFSTRVINQVHSEQTRDSSVILTLNIARYYCRCVVLDFYEDSLHTRELLILIRLKIQDERLAQQMSQEAGDKVSF